ncbi:MULTISPECIES: DUF3742 family protein [Pseudomonadaceae]|jgi:hypothetical protein|uniref:DUF3742 family protein n=2 Tax=Pseudomonadaceae TaxID=135621 RepID=A0ABD7RT48_ECTME|nr:MULTISPECIES: DUF3742 family protein [Pseudomonas]MBG6882720.1 DUF3742 family protein [Pseudomonas aeruginosa]MBI9141202.1 DUF3742 family protein [Pseudomonas aeruginosa]MBV5858638.1 DUF3742 family protein [Pseudomonas aeruginosa]MCS9084335.1 DUF3742 family protein [Pseudomonas aeruginosa]MCT0697487.1 DUF3742 family protein [Pseudomonas aeruginosa]
MDTKARISNAERFGRRIGGMWRGFVRREHQVAGWLVARGLSAGAATVLLWGMKLALLGVLLYAMFWLALLLVIIIIAAWAAQRGAQDEEFEWPFTDLDELRKTPGYDPVLYNDVAHPDYRDEKDD